MSDSFESTYNNVIAGISLQNEWTRIEDVPSHVFDAVTVLADMFITRQELDTQVVTAMIKSGVDPELAWDKNINMRVWLMGMMFAAYGMGAGVVEPKDVPDSFEDAIGELDFYPDDVSGD